jgi:hypothetical protein
MPVGGENKINLKDFELQEAKDSGRKKMIRKEPVPKFNSQAYNPPSWGTGGNNSNSVQRKEKVMGATDENFGKKVCNVRCNEGLIKSLAKTKTIFVKEYNGSSKLGKRKCSEPEPKKSGVNKFSKFETDLMRKYIGKMTATPEIPRPTKFRSFQGGLNPCAKLLSKNRTGANIPPVNSEAES